MKTCAKGTIKGCYKPCAKGTTHQCVKQGYVSVPACPKGTMMKCAPIPQPKPVMVPATPKPSATPATPMTSAKLQRGGGDDDVPDAFEGFVSRM